MLANLRPAVAHLIVEAEKLIFLFPAPAIVVDVGIELIVPPLLERNHL